MPGPCSAETVKGGKTKAVFSSRPAFRGKSSHSLENAPKGLKKKLAKLARRQKSYEETSLSSKSGFRKPGSMNLRKG